MYCRMLPLEHSAILLTFIKLPFVIKIFVLSIFDWPFYTSFTVHRCLVGLGVLFWPEPLHLSDLMTGPTECNERGLTFYNNAF